MADYKVYVHGRPQGQDVWPMYQDTVDRFYIEPFLDDNIGSDVDSLLIADIWQNNFYYTYIHRKNVVENIARGEAGSSYFAITIRMDKAICRNVNTLNNLLSQVYKQLCVGKIISEDKGYRHFLIKRFSDRESDMEQILSVIKANIDKVFSPSLEKFNDTKDKLGIKYSLKDVDSPEFNTFVLKNKVLISSEYPSKSEENAILSNQILPVQKRCKDLEEELNNWKQNFEKLKISNQSLKTEKSKLEEDLSQAKQKVSETFQKEVNEAKENLKSANAKIEQLEKEKKELEEKNSNLEDATAYKVENEEKVELVNQIEEPIKIYCSRLKASPFRSGNIGNTKSEHTSGRDARSSKRINFKNWLPWVDRIVLYSIGAIILSSLYFCKNDKVVGPVEVDKTIPTNNIISNEDSVGIVNQGNQLDSLPTSIVNDSKVPLSPSVTKPTEIVKSVSEEVDNELSKSSVKK